jgi:hypothetical protein
MKTLSYVFLVLLLMLIPGCGSEREKGMNAPNQRKDLPRAAPTSPSDKPTK